MSNAIVAVIGLITAAQLATAQAQPALIQGTLCDQGRAIVRAEVYLQSLTDERCAKLFTSRTRSRKKVQELEQCVHDLAETPVDGSGHFQFAGMKPGWYAVHFLWNIADKPGHVDAPFKRGDWAVIYAGREDSTGRYDTLAQGRPFHFSGSEDVVRSFDNRP